MNPTYISSYKTCRSIKNQNFRLKFSTNSNKTKQKRFKLQKPIITYIPSRGFQVSSGLHTQIMLTKLIQSTISSSITENSKPQSQTEFETILKSENPNSNSSSITEIIEFNIKSYLCRTTSELLRPLLKARRFSERKLNFKRDRAWGI